jgi:glycosyltransferase involved in cell wall biosynthesis
MPTETADQEPSLAEAPVRRPLRIAQISPLYERVPPQLYGGTERVVSYLTEALVARGHAVTLFASGDSVTGARLVPVTERALRLDGGAADPLYEHVLEIAHVFERANDFDLIHSHVDALAFPFSRFVRTPTVHTLHGRLDLPHMRRVYEYFRDVPLVSISDAQREAIGDLGMRWMGTVYHGLPLAEFPFTPTAGRYLAFLGRMAPEKRPDLAIEIAVRAGLPLKLAAKTTRSALAFSARRSRSSFRSTGPNPLAS